MSRGGHLAPIAILAGILVLSNPTGAEAAEASADIADDNYESDTVGSAPPGWTNAGTACDNFDVQNVLVTPDGTKYMRCNRAAGGSAQLQFTWTTVSGIGVVEFLARQENALEQTGFQVLSGGWAAGNIRARIRFNSNITQRIEYLDGATTLWTPSGANWSVDTWYRIRIEMNNAADTYTLYVNNTQYAANVQMENTGLSDFDRVEINVNTDGSNITYVDDLEIYTVKKWIGGTSADWGTAANWAPKGVPADSVSVRFTDQSSTTNQPVLDQTRNVGKLLIDDNDLGPRNVILDLNGFTLAAGGVLDHDSGGTIAVGSGSLTLAGRADMNGTITISTGTVTANGLWDGTGGTVTFTGAGTLALSSVVTAVAGTLTNTAGTVNYNSSGGASGGDQTVDPNVTYYKLTTGGTGTKSLGGNVTVTNVLTVQGARLEVGANTLTLSGAVTHAVNSGGVFKISGAGQLQLADTGTFQVDYAATPGKFVASNTSAKVTKTGAGAGGGTFRIYGEADITGLTFEYAGTSGLELGNGTNNPTVTNFENVTFQNHGGAGYAFMTIKANGGFSMAPTGITFGAITAGNNVKLVDNDGALGGTVVFATFGASGAGKGDTHEVDNDSNEDGTPDTAGGDAVIQWTTSGWILDGAVVGFPTLAFDWGTYAPYAVYVAARDIAGASTADRVYVRDMAGAPLYSYDIVDADGDILGTPVWDTKRETVFGPCDMNNDGDSTDTLHLLYVATGKADPGSVAKIFMLVDTGTALQLPKATCPWEAAYTHANVDEITSPLIYDTNNLYFGGEDSSDVAKIFGVQIADTDTTPGAPVVNVGAASRVQTAPAWKDFTGTVFLYMGSKQSPACPGAGTAHVYRVNTSTGLVETDNSSSALHNVNGMVSLVSSRIHVGDDGGRMHGLDNGSGLANLGSYPYRDTTNHAVADLNNCTYPITAAPYIGYATWKVGYGDADGHYYVLDTTPAPLTGYPFRPGGSTAAFTNGGLAISGVHVVGNANGNVYYIDESAASAFKTYNFGSGVTVGQVGYNSNQQKLMIGTSSGGLYYLAKEADPTP